MRARGAGRTIAAMSFAVISPPTGGSSARALPGRDRELRWLMAGLRAAQRGAGALIAVEGPPGTGKSALLREAQRQAEEHGMLVLTIRALDTGQFATDAHGLRAER